MPFRLTMRSAIAAGLIPVLVSHSGSPLFGVAAQGTTGTLSLTEEELKPFDGTADKPIYLGINGTIFDVSASPAFYGPGGHYHHFVGKEATRAWITECWDSDDQFTWRMEGVEVIYMAKYLDEQMEAAASGDYNDPSLNVLGSLPGDQLTVMAKKVTEKFGKVTAAEKKARRVEDKKEAEAKVQETLAHWIGFFSGNAKYKVVGTVIRDESRPEPPKPCEAAFMKRPIKAGKLESLVGNIGSMMGGGADDDKKPDFVKGKAAEEAKDDNDDEDLVHEEL